MTAGIEEVPEIRESRFNDVIADPEWCVFCGTQPVDNDYAYLFRLGIDGDLTMLLDDVQLSKGL
jgi:D-xylonolactonase